MTITANDLTGIIPPVATPFTADGDLDPDAFRAEVEYTAQFPVGGILVGAATGEGFTLEPDETATLVRIAKEVVGDRLPVLAGVLEGSTRRTVAKSVAAAASGADGLMVTPVTYLPDSPASTRLHYRAVAAESGVPLMIYNSMAHNRLTPEIVVELTEMPEVIAVKLGYGATSLNDLRHVLAEAGDRASIFWSQDQLLFPSYCLGAVGSLSTVDAILPSHTTRLLAAVHAGDFDLARKLDRILTDLGGVLGPDDLPSVLKTAISLQGRKVGSPRAPFAPIEGDRLARIEAILYDAGVLAYR